jgi:arabinogalactan endo-1,4-beta-galactosidase
VRGLPHGKGLGAFIWEPAASNGPALFDRDGNAKLELDIYTEMANDYGKEKR